MCKAEKGGFGAKFTLATDFSDKIRTFATSIKAF